MSFSDFLTSIGQEVSDAEEESFLLFSQDIPSANLGFIDPRAQSVDVTVHDRDYEISQSPTLLSSSRAGGTTGAVLWKITPAFAQWISSRTITITSSSTSSKNDGNKSNTDKITKPNPLWSAPYPILSPTSPIIELGCGISGLVPLALGPSVGHYLATDQEYVRKLFWENVSGNASVAFGSNRYRPQRQTNGNGNGNGKSKGSQQKQKQKQKIGHGYTDTNNDMNINISFTPLDWETDIASLSLKEDSIGYTSNNNTTKHDDDDKGFDLLISCDCIYNESLITPFLRTCADICRLRPIYNDDNNNNSPPEPTNPNPSHSSGYKPGPDNGSINLNPTICIIAQQLRSPDVFETWLREALQEFRVWRVGDDVLGDGLRGGSGYVVHLLILRGY